MVTCDIFMKKDMVFISMNRLAILNLARLLDSLWGCLESGRRLYLFIYKQSQISSFKIIHYNKTNTTPIYIYIVYYTWPIYIYSVLYFTYLYWHTPVYYSHYVEAILSLCKLNGNFIITVKPRFSAIIRSKILFEKRFVRTPKSFFPLQIM